MEAETYLTSGFGLRTAIRAKKGKWRPFGELAETWAPPRIKQILVDPQYGVPYLNTSQIFDIRATPRKWLAFGKTSAAESRLSAQGTILMMASATPGRATITTKAHEGAVISHHFLRVEARDAALKGWVYAYLKSPQGFAMMSGSQYASVIRHIEPHHVAEQPVPNVDATLAKSFNKRFERIVELRNEAHRLTLDAEKLFAEAVGTPKPKAVEHAFVVSASQAFGGRRRLEASCYSPMAEAVFKQFRRWEPLSAVTERVWWMTRFKRHFGEGGSDEGLPYMSADELFSIDPPITKRVLVDPADNNDDYFVKRGWILMACSGQVYGLNGAARLVTAHHEKIFFSHDLIRIIADDRKIRPGYLLTALTHPTHGRPLLIRAAYGTSIPHLDPGDVSEFPVVRLDGKIEEQIAVRAEESAKALADADALDREIAAEAGDLIDDFLA